MLLFRRNVHDGFIFDDLSSHFPIDIWLIVRSLGFFGISFELVILLDQLLGCEPTIQVRSADGTFDLILGITDTTAALAFLSVHTLTTVDRKSSKSGGSFVVLVVEKLLVFGDFGGRSQSVRAGWGVDVAC